MLVHVLELTVCVCVFVVSWILVFSMLQGTPALFLILLFYESKHLSTFVEDEKYVC